MLAAGVTLEADPLLVFTAANAWILVGTYLAWAATCSSLTKRAAVRARIMKYAACVVGVALAAFIKANAPTATRLGITDSILGFGALLQFVLVLALLYWASLPAISRPE